MAFLTPEVLDEKPVLDIHKAMIKDLVAVQRKVGTRDAYFVAVKALPLKGGKRVALLIVASTKEPVAAWVERFKAPTTKPKLLAQGTCSFAKGKDGQVVIELEKITGSGRSTVVDAVAKALVSDSQFTVRDAQVRVHTDEASESEDEQHR